MSAAYYAEAASAEIDDGLPGGDIALREPQCAKSLSRDLSPIAGGKASPVTSSRASRSPAPGERGQPAVDGSNLKALLTGRHAVRNAHASHNLSGDVSPSRSEHSKGRVDEELSGNLADSSAILRAVHAHRAQQAEHGDTSGSGSPPENLSTVKEENPSDIATLSGFNTSTNGRSGKPLSAQGGTSGYAAGASIDDSSVVVRDSSGMDHSAPPGSGAKQDDAPGSFGPPGSADGRFLSSRTQGGVVTVGTPPSALSHVCLGRYPKLNARNSATFVYCCCA